MSVSSALGRIGFGRVLDHPRVSQRFMAQLAMFGKRRRGDVLITMIDSELFRLTVHEKT